MSFIFQRSAGGQLVRSTGGWFNRPPGNAMFQIVYGVVPVCGFGKFTTGSKFNSLSWWAPFSRGGADYTGLVFDEQWPNVFTTLTETMTVGNMTSTRVITYSQTITNPGLVTYTEPDFPDPNHLFDVNGFQSPSNANQTISPDSTSLTIHWTEGTAPNVVDYKYTAVLSNPLNGVANWAAFTAEANALLADFPFPAWNDPTYEMASGFNGLAGQCAGWFIFPSSTGPLVADLPPNISGEWFTLVMAAANGMAARISCYYPPDFWGYASGTGMYSYSPDTPVANAWVQDSPDPGSIASTIILQNCGACVCAKSQWQLLGLAENYPALPGVTYNHLAGVYAQAMTLAQPPYFARNYPKYGTGFSAGQQRTFTPSDVVAALGVIGGGATYGILGFRPPPPVSGGAGGSIAGAGGGAPAFCNIKSRILYYETDAEETRNRAVPLLRTAHSAFRTQPVCRAHRHYDPHNQQLHDHLPDGDDYRRLHEHFRHCGQHQLPSNWRPCFD